MESTILNLDLGLASIRSARYSTGSIDPVRIRIEISRLRFTRDFSYVTDLELRFVQMQSTWIPTLVSTTSWIIPITASSSPRVKIIQRVLFSVATYLSRYSRTISALDTACASVKKQVVELLSALCVYSQDGRQRAIDTLHEYQVPGSLIDRFEWKNDR